MTIAGQTNEFSTKREKDLVYESTSNKGAQETTALLHERLSDVILVRIFVCIAKDHGPVQFPFPPGTFLPQLVLSHVCSRWRMLALQTFELWNNVQLETNRYDFYFKHQLFQEWSRRAANLNVRLLTDPILSLFTANSATAEYIQDLIAPFRGGKISLYLNTGQLIALSKLNNSVLPDVEELEFGQINEDPGKRFSQKPHMFARLRSIIVNESYTVKDPAAALFQFSLPWSQLRCLKLYLPIKNLAPAIETLRQMPMLQDLALVAGSSHSISGRVAKLTMPHLHTILLDQNLMEDPVNLLRVFICPALADLSLLNMEAQWSDETYEMIRQQYNFRELEEIEFVGCGLSVASILKEAPMLRVLSLSEEVIIDDDAIAGLSNGTLGRHLRNFFIHVPDIADALLEMVEKRKKLVDELVETGCNWREAVTLLKEVQINSERHPEQAERLEALEVAGINIVFTEESE
ncbi:hypothetical protein APHAL10511_005667 [Amanita phalloides]|nr:hypothetical protein APHAL10511_005667 [Amanita phalloides]